MPFRYPHKKILRIWSEAPSIKPKLDRLPTSKYLNKPSQISRHPQTNANNSPPLSNNLSDPKPPPRIPNQMPNPINTMERKRPRNRKLQAALDQWTQAPKGCGQTRAIQVPSEEGRDQVRGPENVESARDQTACDSVEGRGEVVYLEPIDREVGGDGSVLALGDEDGVCGGRGVGFGFDASCDM